MRRVHAGEFFCGARTVSLSLWLANQQPPRLREPINYPAYEFGWCSSFSVFSPVRPAVGVLLFAGAFGSLRLLPRLRSPEQYAPDKATCIYIKTQFGLIIGARVFFRCTQSIITSRMRK